MSLFGAMTGIMLSDLIRAVLKAKGIEILWWQTILYGAIIILLIGVVVYFLSKKKSTKSSFEQD